MKPQMKEERKTQGGGSEVQPEMENISEGPPANAAEVKIGLSLGIGDVTPAFCCSRSTS